MSRTDSVVRRGWSVRCRIHLFQICNVNMFGPADHFTMHMMCPLNLVSAMSLFAYFVPATPVFFVLGLRLATFSPDNIPDTSNTILTDPLPP